MNNVTTTIYTLSLHDALPISSRPIARRQFWSCITDTERLVDALGTYNRPLRGLRSRKRGHAPTWTVASIVLVLLSITETDRKSTRLNSSHTVISYAVFCLKKK